MDIILQDLHILLLGMIILVGSAICMHYTNRIFDLSCISIASVWYFAYAATIFIPSFWTFYEKVGHYRFNYIYTMTSAMVTVPLGIVIVNILLKFKPEETRRYYAALVCDRPINFARILTYAFVLMIGIILICLWFIEQHGRPIPLLYLLTSHDSKENLMVLREQSFKLLDSPIRYLYHLTRDFIFPLLIVVAFGNYYISRSRVWLFFLITSSVIGLFYAGANISKSPVFSIIILMLLTLFVLKGAKLSWWQVIIGVVLCLAFPIFVLMAVPGNTSWEGFQEAFQKLMERMFVAPASIAYWGFEIFPERYPFQMGRSIGLVSKLMGEDPSGMAAYAAWYIMGDGFGTTSVAGVFVGELFGDFAYPGLIIGGILVGAAMQWIHVTIIRSPKTIFSIVTYVLFIHFFSTLTYLQIASALILSGAPILWIMYKTKVLG